MTFFSVSLWGCSLVSCLVFVLLLWLALLSHDSVPFPVILSISKVKLNSEFLWMPAPQETAGKEFWQITLFLFCDDSSVFLPTAKQEKKAPLL